jgi:hypothetical protein
MQSQNYQTNPKYLALNAHATQDGANGYVGRYLHRDELFWIDTTLGGSNHAPVANAGENQTVVQGASVTLDGSGSRDLDGNAITYRWTQMAGTAVQLSDPSAASPTFTAPTGSSQNEQLTFQLVVNDGQANSLADAVNVIVQLQAQTCTNIATLATATASSESSQYGQTAAKAIDGTADGYPGDYTKEWATNGQGVGATLTLTWSTPYIVNSLALYDRPNSDDQIIAGTIRFSDGTTMDVGPLDNNGQATEYAVSPARSITGMTLTVTQVSGTTHNVGLSEIRVCGTIDTATNHAPVANAGTDQTVTQGATVTLDGSASSDPDANAITYAWTHLSGTAVTLSDPTAVRPTFTVPTGTAYESLVFQLIVNDGSLSSTADTVTITEQAPTTTCTNIAGLATVTASSDTPLYQQTAAKAIDGTADGYPGDYTREWATNKQGAGAWLNLAWDRSYTVSSVTLHDRPNTADQIVSGTLSFNDGTSITIGPLDNYGAATTYSFAEKTVTSLMLTVSQTSGTTENIGLSEIEVCGTAAGTTNRTPTANAGSDQTVTQGATVTLDGSASSDPDGDAITYAWTQVSGTAVTLSDATADRPTFTAPTGGTTDEQLVFQLVTNDGNVNSTADTVTVTVQPAAQTCVNIASLATVTASSDTPLYQQTAAKPSTVRPTAIPVTTRGSGQRTRKARAHGSACHGAVLTRSIESCFMPGRTATTRSPLAPSLSTTDRPWQSALSTTPVRQPRMTSRR